MEGLGFAALTLKSILANSIGHEPEIRQAARPLQGVRGTWVLSLPPAELARRQTALDLSPPPCWAHSCIAPSGQVVRGVFRQPGARSWQRKVAGLVSAAHA